MIPHQNHVCIVGHVQEPFHNDDATYFTLVSRDLAQGPREYYAVYTRIKVKISKPLDSAVSEGARVVAVGKLRSFQDGEVYIDAAGVQEDLR